MRKNLSQCFGSIYASQLRRVAHYVESILKSERHHTQQLLKSTRQLSKSAKIEIINNLYIRAILLSTSRINQCSRQYIWEVVEIIFRSNNTHSSPERQRSFEPQNNTYLGAIFYLGPQSENPTVQNPQTNNRDDKRDHVPTYFPYFCCISITNLEIYITQEHHLQIPLVSVYFTDKQPEHANVQDLKW